MTRFERAAMRWLRLPPEPKAPAGSEGSVRVFRAARRYYHYALVRWALRQLGVVAGLVFVFGLWQPLQHQLQLELSVSQVERIRREVPLASWLERSRLAEVRPAPGEPERVAVSVGPLLLGLELVGVAIVALQAAVTFQLVRLDYKLRWYIVTDRSLRVREGVASLHESTMTFANIQHLSIEQGPIQRLLGIADLKVRTAGGGSDSEEDSSDGVKKQSLHVGYLHGVDNAAEIRDVILAHLRRLEDAGLGEERARPPEAKPVLEAARAVLAEARALRAAIR